MSYLKILLIKINIELMIIRPKMKGALKIVIKLFIRSFIFYLLSFLFCYFHMAFLLAALGYSPLIRCIECRVL